MLDDYRGISTNAFIKFILICFLKDIIKIMCGRYIQLINSNKIKKKFDIKSLFNENFQSYNIAPSQNSLIITNNEKIDLESANWGFTFNDKKSNILKNVINSRIETLKEKYLFKDSYLKRKCLVPSNGYYEWFKNKDEKTPYFINVPNCETMYFAGIWKYNNFKENIKKNFTIITKKSNNKLNKIHDRMPIILSQNEGENYINDYNSSYLDQEFTSSIEENIDFYSISKYVNNPLNNSIDCIKPLN